MARPRTSSIRRKFLLACPRRPEHHFWLVPGQSCPSRQPPPMRMRSSNCLLLILGLIWFGALASCAKEGKQGESKPKASEQASAERISVAEIGKIRSRVGKEVIVFGKVAGTSTSGSGHQFLNFSNGFKIICLKDDVGKFDGGGPAELYRGKLVEARGKVTSHQGNPQIAIRAPAQIKVIELGAKSGGGSGVAAAEKFELIEVGQNAWVSPAGLRYLGRDPQGLSRRDHILRHAKDQPGRTDLTGCLMPMGWRCFASSMRLGARSASSACAPGSRAIRRPTLSRWGAGSATLAGRVVRGESTRRYIRSLLWCARGRARW